MIVSRDLFAQLFTSANVALHRALLPPAQAEDFWVQWDKYVVALEALDIAPADQRYRDEHIEWFYDLARVSGLLTAERDRLHFTETTGPAEITSGPFH